MAEGNGEISIEEVPGKDSDNGRTPDYCKLIDYGLDPNNAPSSSHSAVQVAENPGPASIDHGMVENESEVGLLTNAKTKMVHTNVVPYQPLPVNPGLKRPANPEPVDPTKKPCYNKSENANVAKPTLPKPTDCVWKMDDNSFLLPVTSSVNSIDL